MSQGAIWIVAGDAGLAMGLREMLSRLDYSVPEPLSTREEALRAALLVKPALVLMELGPAGPVDGVQSAEQMAAACDAPVVLVAGPAREARLQQEKIAAPYGYLLMPAPERELAARIELAICKHQRDRQVKLCEARFRELFEQSSDGIFHSDLQGNFTGVNPAGCALLGYTREEILQLNIRDVITPESLAANPPRIAELKSGVPVRTERWIRRKNGSTFPGEISDKMLADGSLQVILRDISERKRMEQEVARNAHMLSLFVENAPAGIAMFDRGMRYIAASRRYLQDYRLEDREVIGRCMYEVQPEVSDHWKRIHRRCLAGAVESSDGDLWSRPDGSSDWLRWKIEPWFEVTGSIGGLILFSECITAQKQVMQALQASEKKFHNLFEKHAAVKLLIDPVTGRIVDANEAAVKFYGWTAGQLRQMRIQEINQLTPEQVEAEMQKARFQERIHFEFVHRLADGSLRDVEVYSSSIEVDGKILLHSIIHDITSQKLAAQTLRESEERFRSLTKLLPVGVYLADHRGKVIFANSCWLQMTGVSLESIQESDLELTVHPEDRAKVLAGWQEVVGSNGQSGIEFRVMTPAGKVTWVYGLGARLTTETGALSGYIGVNIDITDRKLSDLQLKEQLDELRRWQSVMLGRETRILELKNEVNELLSRLGEPFRYASAGPEVKG